MNDVLRNWAADARSQSMEKSHPPAVSWVKGEPRRRRIRPEPVVAGSGEGGRDRNGAFESPPSRLWQCGVDTTPGFRLRCQRYATFVAERGVPRPLKALPQGDTRPQLRCSIGKAPKERPVRYSRQPPHTRLTLESRHWVTGTFSFSLMASFWEGLADGRRSMARSRGPFFEKPLSTGSVVGQEGAANAAVGVGCLRQGGLQAILIEQRSCGLV